jgi:4-hydroxybenzoate polyprenyltransferase|tara:strand:+ start:7642 stop:7980 length:339 start_codon:yes stop_codon:yes gene_type:complete
MEFENKTIENLLVSIEDYSKTGVDLLTLKFVKKSSDVLAKLITYFILIIIFSFCLMLISVGLSFWLGTMLGAYYLGFLILAAAYAIAGIIIIRFFPKIIRRIKNSIISQMLN